MTASVLPTSLTVAGFAGTGGSLNLTVANGSVTSQAFPVNVGVHNPLVSPSAARRFLEQAAFGPDARRRRPRADHRLPGMDQRAACHAWISNYNPLLNTARAAYPIFPDQRGHQCGSTAAARRVRSQPDFRHLDHQGDLESGHDSLQQMLINDAFTNYRQILGDVTLSPAMGDYLDMANNAKANPAAGTRPTRTTRAR